MKIAILIYALFGNGFEHMAYYPLLYPNKRGMDVHLVFINHTIGYDIPKDGPIRYIETLQGGMENGFHKFIKLPLAAYKYAKLLNYLKIIYSFTLLRLALEKILVISVQFIINSKRLIILKTI